MEDEKKSGLQISLGDFVSLFPLRCAFGIPEVFFFAVRRRPGPQFPHRRLPAHMDGTASTTYMPCTPYMHTIKYIHCHCNKRDVRRRHREPAIPAPGTAHQSRPGYDAVLMMMGPSSAK
jgi:hypothetical protein